MSIRYYFFPDTEMHLCYVISAINCIHVLFENGKTFDRIILEIMHQTFIAYIEINLD